MAVLGLFLATLVGISLGALGAGGSILTVPIFVHVLGQGMKSAVASSLVVVGATSTIGLARHARCGNVELRAGLLFAALAMVGSFAGARWSMRWSESSQSLLFAVVMLASGLALFRRGAGESSARPAHESPPRMSPLRSAIPALGVGVLTGLVGVGGGFLVVPALVLVAGLSMKHAIGTSLLVIALNCAAGLAGYAGRVELPWALVGGVTAFSSLGILAGVKLADRIPAAKLRVAFASLLVVLSAALLVEQRAVLFSFVPEGLPCC